jgi:uncharacterized coiled-coil DUF342 family protein
MVFTRGASASHLPLTGSEDRKEEAGREVLDLNDKANSLKREGAAVWGRILGLVNRHDLVDARMKHLRRTEKESPELLDLSAEQTLLEDMIKDHEERWEATKKEVRDLDAKRTEAMAKLKAFVPQGGNLRR